MTGRALMWNAIVGLFLMLALLFVLLRGQIHLPAEDGAFALPFASWGNACGGELRPCLRVGGAVLGQMIHGAANVATEPLFWGLTRADGAHTPWPIVDSTQRVKDALLPLVVTLAYGVLCLCPILLAAQRLFASNWSRLVFIMVLFGALFGWHPAVVTAFFNAAALVVDWPRSYYLFDVFVLFYDLMSIGLVVAAVLLAARNRTSLWAVLALAALGQATLEHMGFVVGLILAVGALSQGWRLAFQRLFVSGGGALVVAVAVVAGFYAMGGATAQETASGSPLFTRYLPINLAWFKVILANVLTMTVLAFAGGVLAGALAGALGDGDGATSRRAALAAAGGMAAFMVVMLAGLVFLAYPAEMGRQFLPMAVLAALCGCCSAQALVLRVRRPALG